MATAFRHVRHDWKTFVDWEQKSVKTLCGVTTKRHLAGIPGVSDQPLEVNANGRTLSGWCVLCAIYANDEARRVVKDVELLPEIQERYIKATMATERAANVYREAVAKRNARV